MFSNRSVNFSSKFYWQTFVTCHWIIEPWYDSKGISLHHLKINMEITSNFTFKSFSGFTLLISRGQNRKKGNAELKTRTVKVFEQQTVLQSVTEFAWFRVNRLLRYIFVRSRIWWLKIVKITPLNLLGPSFFQWLLENCHCSCKKLKTRFLFKVL